VFVIERVGFAPRVCGNDDLVAVLVELIDQGGDVHAAPGNTLPHCLNARLVVMIVERLAWVSGG
jgi:hypothetical protein